MNWKFWQKEEEPVAFIPVLPDHRVKEEEDRFNDLMDAWIHGKPPFKDAYIDLWNRRSLTGEIAYLKDEISRLEKRVDQLEGNDPQVPTRESGRFEIHVEKFLDHDADKAKEIALAGSNPAVL